MTRVSNNPVKHLAGRLGVGLLDSLIERRFLMPRERSYGLTVAGSHTLRVMGVRLARPWDDPHPAAYPCFDRTEHRPHLAGHYARQIAARLFELRWLERDGRIVTVTPAGRTWLHDRFGLRWDDP